MRVKEKFRVFFGQARRSTSDADAPQLRKGHLGININLPPINEMSKMILTQEDLERELVHK